MSKLLDNNSEDSDGSEENIYDTNTVLHKSVLNQNYMTMSDICSTVEAIVASTEKADPPLQINTQQCKFLAKKASESLHTLEKYLQEGLVGEELENISSALAAKELHRVLKDAKNLVTDCCDGHWLKVVIRRGTMKEAFQGLVYNIQFYTSLLNSTLTTQSKSGTIIAFEKTICDGKLDIADSSNLVAAAQQDQDSILDLLKCLKGDHTCGGSCVLHPVHQQCLASQYLDKMDGEELLLSNRNCTSSLSMPNPFLSVHPRDFSGKGRFLGKGSYGTVKEREWMGDKYAVKKFTGESAVHSFKKEISALAGLNHPNIVHVVGCFKKDEFYAGIIMELMYKSLSDLLKDHRRKRSATCPTSTPFSIIQAVDLMLQIGEGVRYIHGKSKVHYDLKSLNILVQLADREQITTMSDMDISNVSFIAKISDFDQTKIKNASTEYSHQTRNKGSLAWRAPELFEIGSEPHPTRVQSRKTDVYSFGVVCSEILSGNEPYANLKKLKARVKNGERPKLPKETPMRLICLIKQCWDNDPRKRPDFPEICEELRYIKSLLIRGDKIMLEHNEKGSISYLIGAKVLDGIPIKSFGLILLSTFQVNKANVEKRTPIFAKDENNNKIGDNGAMQEEVNAVQDVVSVLNKRNGAEKDIDYDNRGALTDFNEFFSVGGLLILCKTMKKFVSSIWNFDKASGNDVIVSQGHHPSKAKHAETSGVIFVDSPESEDSNKSDDKGDDPQENADNDTKVAILQMNGTEKYYNAVNNNDCVKKAFADFDAASGFKPDCASTLKYRTAVNNDDYKKALVDFDVTYDIEPDCASTLKYRAAIKCTLERYEEALQDLDLADQIQPDVPYAEPDENSEDTGKEEPPEDLADDVDHKLSLLNKSGAEKYDTNDYLGALADFDAAYDIEPLCASTLKYRAEIKRILGRFEESLEDLNLADQIQPNDVFTLSTRGSVYKELKRYNEALDDLNKANELDSSRYFIKSQRAVVKRSLRDFEGALVDLNEANALRPNQAYVLAQLGVVKRELGNFEEALKHLDTAHELNSNDAFVYQQRGVVKRELGDLEGALYDLNMAHSINPDDSYTLCRRGVTRRELLDYQGSLEDLNMSNTLEQCNNLTLNERGVTKKLLGDFQGALEDLCMANHIKSEQAFTLKHRGSANRELGNLLEALHDLTSANHLEPNDFFKLLELAMTKNLSKDYEGALNDYNRVVEMEPNDSWILRERGKLKRILQDYEGAFEDFKRGDIDSIELRPKLFSITIGMIIERCFTKYEIQDVAGALQDAKMVRKLWGAHGQSLIVGEKLKPATIQCRGPPEHASSISQRLSDISHYVMWIDHQNLKFVKNIGRGSYGYVQKCKWEGKNRCVAVKYVSSQIQDAFEKEVEMLARIQHPRVVRLIGCSYDNIEKEGLLVMELMEYNLRSLIELKKRERLGPPFELSVGVHLMVQIAHAMEYLHEQGVLHRDLKSSNVLVNSILGNGDQKEQYAVKIADFGMAKLQGQNNMPYFMTSDAGATLWRAPEVFRIGAYQKYSFPADVWSYGITCFEILSGELPFEGVPCSQIRVKILGGLRPELPASCPGVLKLLLKKCWSFSPSERPTFSQIHKVLRLYNEGVESSRDTCEFRAGGAIRACELRKRISF